MTPIRAATIVALSLALAAPAAAAEYFCTPAGVVEWRTGVPAAAAPPDYAADELGTLGFWVTAETGDYGERLARNRAGISLEATLDMLSPGSGPGAGTESLLGVDRESGLVVRIETWMEDRPFIHIGPNDTVLVGTCELAS